MGYCRKIVNSGFKPSAPAVRNPNIIAEQIVGNFSIHDWLLPQRRSSGLAKWPGSAVRDPAGIICVDFWNRQEDIIVKNIEVKIFEIEIIAVERAVLMRREGKRAMKEDNTDGTSPDVRRALKLFIVLARASASVGERARRDVARHSLSVSEFGVLELLFHKGPQPQSEIADRILLTTGSVTYVIDQLVKQGLVERRSCPGDRRVVFAALTEAGRDRIAAIFPEHIDCIADAVSGLTAGEQEAAIALLKKLGKAAKEVRL